VSRITNTRIPTTETVGIALIRDAMDVLAQHYSEEGSLGMIASKNPGRSRGGG
jgi:hypothetical protein